MAHKPDKNLTATYYNFSPVCGDFSGEPTEPFFSRYACETCGTVLHGNRHYCTATIGKAHTNIREKLEICIDCFEYFFNQNLHSRKYMLYFKQLRASKQIRGQIMARKKGLFAALFSSGRSSSSLSKRYAASMKILRSTKPTKLRNAKAGAGCFKQIRGRKMISDKDTAGDEQKETVDIIASGYEWICSECEMFHEIIEYPKTGMVQCEQ